MREGGITFRTGERLEFAEYVELLRCTDLGREYPAGRFREEIPRLLASATPGPASAPGGDGAP